MKETAIVSTKDSEVFLSYNAFMQSRESERTYKTYIWKTAIGLQQVDGLKPSEYLIRTAERNIIGDISFSGAEQEIISYYRSKEETFTDLRSHYPQDMSHPHTAWVCEFTCILKLIF